MPKNSSPEIIGELNKEINAGLADPKIRAQLGGFGAMVPALSPADFGKLIAHETKKWAEIVKFASIRPN